MTTDKQRYETLRKLSPREFADICERNLRGENFDEIVDQMSRAANEYVSAKFAEALKEIERCIETLNQHRAHWAMTKNLNVLPSDAQIAILVKTLKKASASLQAEPINKEREIVERLNRWKRMSNADLRLRCGELTAQEIRIIRAVLKSINQHE